MEPELGQEELVVYKKIQLWVEERIKRNSWDISVIVWTLRLDGGGKK